MACIVNDAVNVAAVALILAIGVACLGIFIHDLWTGP